MDPLQHPITTPENPVPATSSQYQSESQNEAISSSIAVAADLFESPVPPSSQNIVAADLLQSLIIPPTHGKSWVSENASSITSGPAFLSAYAANTTTPTTTMVTSHAHDYNSCETIQYQNENNNTSSLPRVTDFMNMEDFETAHVDKFSGTQPKPSDVPLSPSSSSVIVASEPAPLTPVPLGKIRTAEHIIKFTQLCQEKRVTPIWSYLEPEMQQFEASVEIAGIKVKGEGRFGSKKEAKEDVAMRACAIVKTLAGQKRQEASDTAKENWIGKLLEFTNATSIGAPMYQEFAVGSFFACEVTLAIRPDEPFGSRDDVSNSKKEARQKASKNAVLWLIENQHLDDDGRPIKKKKVKSNSGVTSMREEKIAENGNDSGKETSFAQQVVVLCSLLGFTPPDYRLIPTNPSAPAFYSGGAYFPHNPEIPAPIGEVRNIYGRKSAREECSKSVLSYLVQIRRDRQEEIQEVLRAAGSTLKVTKE